MDQGRKYRRIWRPLLTLCLLQSGLMAVLGAAIHMPPSNRMLLVPRSDALYVVGENRFGFLRILPFRKLNHLEKYLESRGFRIPVITQAHLRPEGRVAEFLDGHRLTWSSPQLGDPFGRRPVVETHNVESAVAMRDWIENGNLRESRLGFAIPLEALPAATYDP